MELLSQFKDWIGEHWKTLTLILVVGLVLFLFVYAHQIDQMSTESPPATSTVTMHPLELNIRLEQTKFLEGEPIKATVSLRNLSNQTVELHTYHPIFDFRIIDARGNTVYTWAANFLWVGELRKTLNHAEQLNYTQYSHDPHEHPFQLSAGEYRIEEFTTVDVTCVELSKALGARALVTPPITILIIPSSVQALFTIGKMMLLPFVILLIIIVVVKAYLYP